MIVGWTDEFDRWLSHSEEQGGRLLAVATALRKRGNTRRDDGRRLAAAEGKLR